MGLRMGWALQLFVMKSMGHVVLRTAWVTLTVAIVATLATNRAALFLFPQYYSEIAATMAAFAFFITIMLAMPLLFGFHLMSLRLASTNRQLISLASLDPLTSLLNRRSFADAFETLMRKSRRQDHNPCLLVIDVDYFKAINDQYGHDAGDRVLVQLGSMLRGHSGGSSYVARLGGEEFGILRHSENIVTAKQFAESLRASVEQVPFWYNGHCLKITVSVGWHMIGRDEKLASALKNADAALYRAKNNGRNCIAHSSAKEATLAPDAEDMIQTVKNKSSSQLASSK